MIRGKISEICMSKWPGDFVKKSRKSRPVVVDFTQNHTNGLNLDLRLLPHLRGQKRRKVGRKSSLLERKMCGADTETIDGNIWLFSTEFGVWEINTLGDLIAVLYNKYHAKKWSTGKKSNKKLKRKATRGVSTMQFFFWNLKYDAQSIMHFLDKDQIDMLLVGEKVEVDCVVPNYEQEIKITLKYLEGKYLEIKPDWKIGEHKVGTCYWWDISQFYFKARLNNAAKKFLGETKIEKCFDGSILDVGRLNEESYRIKYRKDIEKYAVQDAVLAGKLARLKRQDYVSQDIRFIQPYSLANVAQRELLSSCEIPTINDYIEDKKLNRILQIAQTSFFGGWFETCGNGRFNGCMGVDLASAYPYVMYHLPNTSRGNWIRGDCEESFRIYLEKRTAFEIGFCEVFIEFPEGRNFYPLVQKSKSGTLVTPRIVKGWFTIEEIQEALKWNPKTFILGEWYRFREDDSKSRPFRPFIDKFYELKMNSESGSVPYNVAKVQLNSIYGKTVQCIDGKIGKMWNPIYGSTITGSTRARLAELIRLNDYSALSVATDGIIFPKDKLTIIPDRPLEAPHNLGNWEHDGEGDLIVIMSGVYSMQTDNYTKTTFRGSASYFLRGFNVGGIFRFCEENKNRAAIRTTVMKPYSAKEARIKNDYSLINVFAERQYSISALGDSTKRLWVGEKAKNFGDLLTKWWYSKPHRNIDDILSTPDTHDLVTRP